MHVMILSGSISMKAGRIRGLSGTAVYLNPLESPGDKQQHCCVAASRMEKRGILKICRGNLLYHIYYYSIKNPLLKLCMSTQPLNSKVQWGVTITPFGYLSIASLSPGMKESSGYNFHAWCLPTSCKTCLRQHF